VTVTDFAAAAQFANGDFSFYAGYETDVYVVRSAGGGEVRISKAGGGHHPTWERDIAVKPIPRKP
jgi:hypothetical protein